MIDELVTVEISWLEVFILDRFRKLAVLLEPVDAEEEETE